MKANLITLPGLVDVHVHLREPGGIQKEDFETGTKAAVAGGYTQILDMPNNIPPTVDLKSLNNKIKRAKSRIWCDLGFNFGATAKSTIHFGQVINKVFGLKIYMSQTTGPLLVNEDEEREVIFKSWKSTLPIMVHAKDEVIEDAIALSKKYKKHIHICHVTYNQLSIIKKAKKNGLQITSEVCPHHLFLNKTDVKKLGNFGLMKPPLMTKLDQEKIWGRIEEIDMISTDHAPHTREEKLDLSEPKFGVPGLETTVPLFFDAISSKKISLARFIKMTSANPRRIFKLPSQENTYIIVDTSKNFKISDKNLFTKSAWTPFVGMEGRGKIKKVVIRGKTVYEDGKFAPKPSGRIIYPKSM